MTDFSTNILQKWFDYQALPIEAIALSPDQIDQAVDLSEQIPEQARQWQTYLNALALFGFQQWLEQRAGEFTLNWKQCSVFQPEVANAIAAVCHLKVDKFQLCLIVTNSLNDDEVTLPRAIVDVPEFIPHFYVLVEVQEEQEIAVICGFLSYKHLVNRQETVHLSADKDWTYQLPLSWFDSDPDRLLLYLRCLDEEAIPLPTLPENRLIALSKIQKELATLLPQMRLPDQELWQILTWEQGVAVLTNPELLSWVYKLQKQTVQTENVESLRLHLSDLLQLLTQPAVNVGRWLRNELDGLAQEFSWILLSNLAPTALRSPIEEFGAIASQLKQRGQEIPLQARGAYREVLLAGIPLRLYAITWPLLSDSEPQWWSLLLVLGIPSEMTLPCSLKFRVSEKTGVLAEQVLNPEQREHYLFTCVVGDWNERFLVTVGLTNGLELTLPPFGFEPERDRLGL